MESLWDSLSASGTGIHAVLHGRGACVRLAELASGSCLREPPQSLRGRAVAIATRDQLSTALALIELDGIARRLVVCTPELSPEQLRAVLMAADADTLVCDPERADTTALARRTVLIDAAAVGPRPERAGGVATEWLLLTSGTTGMPKLVIHSLATLAGALPTQAAANTAVWSTFYDIRRYGGLQIFLRAMLGNLPLVLSAAEEPAREFLARAGAARVTHISGTPSHWRRALMSGAAALLSPEYVRLSGEIADQALLDALHHAYPAARIAHAFASTEAGVAFDVGDGRAGFPAALVGQRGAAVDMKVEDGTLRIRSGRNALRYVGDAAPTLVGEDGYVDTGDMVELREGRYYFVGRRGGVINVGGLKVHPEEVETVINADPRVRMSLVRGRRNPITGSVVVADVVLVGEPATSMVGDVTDRLRQELLEHCRRALPAHKVPTALRFVPSLELTAAGKLVRPGA